MSTPRSVTAGAFLAVAVFLTAPSALNAQFSGPCRVGCAATLMLDSYLVASGTAVAIGRSMGGFSRTSQGVISWGSGFVFTAGAGIALQGDGNRQRRAVYGGAIGGALGGVVGLGVAVGIGKGSAADRLSAALIGGGIGVLAGGALGAIMRGSTQDPSPTPLFALRLPL